MSRGLDHEPWEQPNEERDDSRVERSPGRSGGGSDTDAGRERRSPDTLDTFDLAALRTRIDAAANGRPALPEFIDRLEASGVRVIPSVQSNGRLNGFTYEFDGVRIKASALGRAYTPKGLQEKKHISYEPSRDGERLRRALDDWSARSPAPTRPERLDERIRQDNPREAHHRSRQRDELTATQRELMMDVGRFRTVALPDLARTHYAGDYRALERDLSRLTARNLVERNSVALDNRRSVLHVVALTREGKSLLRRRAESTQAIYAGIAKPREVAHDAAIYRMYQAEADRIERAGGTVRSVVLDYELKKRIYSPLAKAKDLSPFEYAQRQEQIAKENSLKVVDGHIVLPDLRLEFENAQGELAKVDLELATRNYRAAHMKAKAQAGFKVYVQRGHAGAPVFDDHDLVGDILSL
jgi:hypothetical protein